MNILSLFEKINVFVFDIDGVLTDGQLLLSETEMLRSMNTKDGFALQLAVKKGYEVVVISGGTSQLSKSRLEKLGIEKVFIGVPDKFTLLQKLATKHQWNPEQMLYMGDDLPDLACLNFVGLATCPSDAARELLKFCPYISENPGGRGAVRDVIEKVLTLRGDWPDIAESVHW